MAMAAEKVIEALHECLKVIKWGDIYGQNPTRCSEDEMDLSIFKLGTDRAMNHLVFLCIEAERMMREEPHRREKIMRWLGFIQGALWGQGLTTISGSKNMNRPDRV